VDDRSAEVRFRVIEALTMFPATDPQYLLDALQDRDELVRVQAAESIAIRKERRALGRLRKALADRSDLVRSYAAAAIGALGDDADRPLLRRRLAREKSETARVGFLEGLWLLKDGAVLDEAIRLLDSDDYRIRCAAAHALAGTFVSARTRDRIREALRSRLRRENAMAVREALDKAIRAVPGSRRNETVRMKFLPRPR
jgi:HEAT repeat protein